MAQNATQGAQDASQKARSRQALTVGASVRVERDETRHPSHGTWPMFRGRTGTIIEINRAGRGKAEYGVGFGKSRRVDAWFKSHELERA